MMQAIELVVDETTGDRTPEKALTNRVFEETRKRGLLVGKSGLEGNVFRVAPPLNVTRGDVEEALAIIRESFEAAGARERRAENVCPRPRWQKTLAWRWRQVDFIRLAKPYGRIS